MRGDSVSKQTGQHHRLLHLNALGADQEDSVCQTFCVLQRAICLKRQSNCQHQRINEELLLLSMVICTYMYVVPTWTSRLVFDERLFWGGGGGIFTCEHSSVYESME